MEGLQITAKGVVSPIEKKELFEGKDSVKVRVTKTLLTQEDFQTFCEDTKNYPIIPGRTAIGKIIETFEIKGSGVDVYKTDAKANAKYKKDGTKDNEVKTDSNGFARGMNVLLHSVYNCNKCFECSQGNSKHCRAFNIAGKNVDGFLRDFAIVDKSHLSILPPSVSEFDALFIDYVAACVQVVDSINLQKGEHVAIVGGDVLGNILAQLIIYYQGVPILVDSNEKNLQLAKDAGIYYVLFADNRLEKNVAELTGARMAGKVVYMTGANLNTDIALRLAGHNATICLAGFGAPSIRVNFNTALTKSLQFNCVTNGFGNYDTAINIMANKVIDTSIFKIKSVRTEDAIAAICDIGKTQSYAACENMLIVDMDKF